MEKIKVAIIGAGPAGASCAIYMSRAMLSPVMFAGTQAGGQLMFTTSVENYAGFPDGVQGPDLMIATHKQAEKFGTRIEYKFVTAVDFSSRPFKLWTKEGGLSHEEMAKLNDEDFKAHLDKIRQEEHDFEADSVVITTGSEALRLGIPGEDKFFGRGVSVCAVCDAAFFKDKKTVVVGGGDSAMEDALALAKFSSEVTVIHRRGEFKASKIMQERVLNNTKIKVMWNSEPKEVLGENQVTGVKVANTETGEESQLEIDGFFIAIGHRPMTRIFKDQVALDDHGYLVTAQSATKPGVEMASSRLGENGLVAYPTMTNVEGIFGAGDQVDVRFKQAIFAAGLGAGAAIDAERWLESQG